MDTKTWRLVFILSTIVATGLTDISIIPRTNWGAQEPSSPLELIPQSHLPVPYVIVHHSANFTCPSNNSCSETVRNIQLNSINNKGFPDLSFNFLVDPTGEIFEGRGWSRVGSHAPGYNNRSCGICIIGNYSTSEPSSRAIASLQNLIQSGVNKGHISPDYKLVAHRQVRPRDCPGDKFYEMIQKLPNWESDPK